MKSLIAGAVVLALGGQTALSAQTLGPDFVANYAFTDLGTPMGVPAQLGGILFKPGDSNTLLIGGDANASGGAIYEVPVTRDLAGHVVGFGGTGIQTIAAPNIDGGIAIAPNGTMMVTTYSNNRLLQYLPGSTTPDADIDLTALGVTASVGTCQFVPAGFAGAGTFKVASYSASTWFDVALTANAQGTYDLTSATQTVATGGGPEGIVYIQGGNTGFLNDSVLVSEYGLGVVAAYDIDGNGDPIPATRRTFLSGLSGAEGAVIDPVTGDFLFSTFGGQNRVVVVSGFDQPTIFCGGKVSSAGCVPTIDFVNTPSLSGSADFTLTATGVLNNSFGILVWSTTPGSIALGGGTLCLDNHMYRQPAQFSGGTPGSAASDCTGTYMDVLAPAWLNANLLGAGTTVYVQYIGRDQGFAPPNNYSLSDGLRFTVLQ